MLCASSRVLAAALFVHLASARDLYGELGLARSADTKAIKKAWHLIALKEHPDKVEGGAHAKEAAAERFKRAAEAYEVLLDAALRSQYDRTGIVPDDKAKNAASSKSKGGGAGEDEYGFDAPGGARQRARRVGLDGASISLRSI